MVHSLDLPANPGLGHRRGEGVHSGGHGVEGGEVDRHRGVHRPLRFLVPVQVEHIIPVGAVKPSSQSKGVQALGPSGAHVQNSRPAIGLGEVVHLPRLPGVLRGAEDGLLVVEDVVPGELEGWEFWNRPGKLRGRERGQDQQDGNEDLDDEDESLPRRAQDLLPDHRPELLVQQPHATVLLHVPLAEGPRAAVRRPKLDVRRLGSGPAQ
mmetsp:Transcript_6069/g.18376  ORF Transcript_6069/g.18376 Transcript_6069/m.18376 type:complete len:209 (-) Transcript_6069:2967-3593(-)